MILKVNAKHLFAILIGIQLSFVLNLKSSDRQAIINQPECGRRINEIRGERIKKIAGGQQANPEDWGWQAILYLRGRFICGGSLINNEWVITAAHCISSNNAPSDYSIRLGLHNRFNPENYSILRNLSDIIIHPNNQFDYRKFDIALIKLFLPVQFTNQILPICLPSENYDFENQMAWATGWGSLSLNGFTSSFLMEVEMPILNDSVCNISFLETFNYYVNTTISLCAGKNNQGKDTCQGDSGGPLVVKVEDRWILAGITSWGYGCSGSGVYTRTSFFLNWILKNIQDRTETTLTRVTLTTSKNTTTVGSSSKVSTSASTKTTTNKINNNNFNNFFESIINFFNRFFNFLYFL